MTFSKPQIFCFKLFGNRIFFIVNGLNSVVGGYDLERDNFHEGNIFL